MRISILTSFRSFRDGSENTRIQLEFLKAVEHLSISNLIELVAVQWSEIGVEEAISNFHIDHKVIRLGAEIPFFRYSLSDVLNFGIPKCLGNIIVYSTCDVRFSEQFLKEILEKMSTYELVVPFPYHESTLKELNEGRSKETQSGLDVFVFQAEILQNWKEKRYFEKFRMLGWGMFDHFLVLLSIRDELNLCKLDMGKSMIKFVNDRTENSETTDWMKRCHKYNTLVMREFINIKIRYLPILRLQAVYQVIDGTRLSFKNIYNYGGLFLIKSQLKFLVSRLFHSRLQLQPKV